MPIVLSPEVAPAEDSGSLIDKDGHVWRLDGPGTSVATGITLDGKYCGQGAAKLTIKAGVVWGQHMAGDWFTLVAPGVATQQAGPPP